MSDKQSRRGFLALTGAGAAAIGVATVVPAGTASAAEPEPEVPAGAKGPLMAYVADVRQDTVSLMVGEREVVVNDPDLVARLAQAAS